MEYSIHIANGQWTEQEAQQSSTWHELRVVKLVLGSLAKKLSNHRVHWLTDNQRLFYVHGSEQKLALQVEALALFVTRT